jgi:hypothetical protein
MIGSIYGLGVMIKMNNLDTNTVVFWVTTRGSNPSGGGY